MTLNEIRIAIRQTEERLKIDPELRKRAELSAEEWIKGNKEVQKNSRFYRAYFKAVMIERAAMELGLI